MKKIILILMLSLSLVGCGQSQEKNDDTASGGEYKFVVNDIKISLGEKADKVLKSLGEPTNTFEEKSCAFEGYDIVYYYSGFELQTSKPEDEDETIAVIDIKDDSVQTEEGISIGSSYDDMIDIYGKDYKESGSQYTYIKNNTQIVFIIENETIISITYSIPS